MTSTSVGFYPSLSRKPCGACGSIFEAGAALEHFAPNASLSLRSSPTELIYNPVHVACAKCLLGRAKRSLPTCPTCNLPIHFLSLGEERALLPGTPALPSLTREAELTVALYHGDEIAVRILLHTYSLSEPEMDVLVPIALNSKKIKIIQLLLNSGSLSEVARGVSIIKCVRENLKGLEELLKSGPISTIDHGEAFVIAAEQGNLEALRALSDPSPPNYAFPIALSKAALSNQEAVVEFLLPKSERKKSSLLCGSALLLTLADPEKSGSVVLQGVKALLKATRPFDSQIETALKYTRKTGQIGISNLLEEEIKKPS